MSKILISIMLLAALVGLLRYTLHPGTVPSSTGTPVSSAMGSDTVEGYARAYQPRPFVFPKDHGPHPDFRVEWWYVTGNLADASQRRFGYQLTLFRIALSPETPPSDSSWRTNQLYMGHFAVTDVAGDRHHGFERFSRAAVGLAGAVASPFRVWLEDWSLNGTTESPFPLHLQAREDGIAVDLVLEKAKPLVLQGEAGLHRKSIEPGNASYYYSYTRLRTRGSVRINGRSFAVNGSSWLDREWSSGALGPKQGGWDWFALQLDDGRDLMFYRLRRKDGSIDPLSSGVLVAPDGSVQRLEWQDVVLEARDTWISPHSGDRYPAGWTLRIPSEDLALDITPRIADQEMRTTVRYWEGTVAVEGRVGDARLTGQGYLEMTRYETPL